MKSLRSILSGFFAAITLAFMKVSTSAAQMDSIRSGLQAAKGPDQPANLFNGDGAIFSTVVSSMLFVIGALAVIMIIIGGFRYVISGGNASSVSAAKNTILYAVVGVVVALLAYAILDFILRSLGSGTATGL